MDKGFFPYGNKSVEFLLKRSFYLCMYLSKKVDKIILACNTLSIVALPFLKQFFNVEGVIQKLLPYINDNSAVIATENTINYLKELYPNTLFIYGNSLIYKIQNNINYDDEISNINDLISNKNNLILGCTHFLALDENIFKIKIINNSP